MKQYQFNKTVWRKNGDGTVCLRDARGLIGSDPHVIEIPEVVYEDGKELPVAGLWYAVFQGITTAIRKISIPKSVIYIPDGAFYTPQCGFCYDNDGISYHGYDIFRNLDEIVVDLDNKLFAGAGPGLYSKDLTKMIFFPENSTQYDTIPKQTTEVANGFFCYRDCSLMPERILKYKEKEPDITQEHAFSNDYWYEEQCGGRLLVNFSPFADSQGNVDLLQYNDQEPIADIAHISGDWNNVTLPDTIKIISSGTFLKANVKSINLPKSVEEIGCCAFFPWNGTDTLDLPATLKEVEPLAFDGADKVKHLVLPQGIKNGIFLFNFTNLETIELKESVNGQTNFILEDGVLYSADKSMLVKYLKTKTDKEFLMPKEVKNVVEGAFRNNPYIEKIIIPIRNINIVEKQCEGQTVQFVRMDGHYIDTVKAGWPSDKNGVNLEEAFACYNRYFSALATGDTYNASHTSLGEWEESQQKCKSPMFAGCTALKALVYEDGTYVYNEDFDVTCEDVTYLLPPTLFTEINVYDDAFFLIDGVQYRIDSIDRDLTLEYYPAERKDEVFTINKNTDHILSLESKYIKKLVINNTGNTELFKYPLGEDGLGYNYMKSIVNLPVLEEIVVTGDDGCFFVENGCLFHTYGETRQFDIAIPSKADWGQSQDDRWIPQKIDAETVAKIEKGLDGTYFYSPMYDMAVRKNEAGQYFAKFDQEAYYLHLEDWLDEDTGDMTKISTTNDLGNITTDEIELSSDCCILDEFNKKGGMLPLTEYLYHTIGSKWKNTLCKEDQYKYDSEIGYCTYDEQTLTEFGAMAAIGYHYTRSDFVVLIFRKPSEEDVEKADAVTLASLRQ